MQPVDMGELTGVVVIFVYPWTGKPDHPNPENWDNIPGAHGSTPQSLAYSTFYDEFCTLGVKCYGLSQLEPEWQKDFAQRNNLKVPLVSDEAGSFARGLGLEYLVTGGKSYLKRRTLVALDRKIILDRTDVTPPEDDAGFVLSKLNTIGLIRLPLHSLPLVGRAGVGVAPALKTQKEFFSSSKGLSDPHPNPPHKGEGIAGETNPNARLTRRTTKLPESNSP